MQGANHHLAEFSVELPLPPSVNRTYRTTKGGGFYRSAEATAWLERAVWIIQAAAPRHLYPDALLAIEVTVHSQARRDIDAGIKILLDGVAAAVGIDDSRVMELRVTKHVAPRREHRCIVTVREFLESTGYSG